MSQKTCRTSGTCFEHNSGEGALVTIFFVRNQFPDSGSGGLCFLGATGKHSAHSAHVILVLKAD